MDVWKDVDTTGRNQMESQNSTPGNAIVGMIYSNVVLLPISHIRFWQIFALAYVLHFGEVVRVGTVFFFLGEDFLPFLLNL